MKKEISLFSTNEGIGGFEQGNYDVEAKYPINTCWTRNSRFCIPDIPSLLWKTGLNDGYLGEMCEGASFVINKNDEVLVVENDNNLDGDIRTGRLLNISYKGEIKEIFHYKRTLKSPIIGKNGLIYLSTDGHSDSIGHKLFCLNSDGNLMWEYDINHLANSNPVLDAEGNIYLFTFLAGNGTLFSISKKGTLNWKYELIDVNWSDPIISQEGIIYIGLNISKTLTAFNKEGYKLWQLPITHEPSSETLNLRNDRTIYLCQGGILYSINSDGSINWKYKPSEGSVINTPAMDNEGNLYLNTTPYWLVALDSNGKELWKNEIAGATLKAPIVGSNGRLFQQSFMQEYPQYNSWIEVFSVKGEKLWTYEMKGFITSAALADDNLLYVISNIYTYKRKGWKGKMDVKWEMHAIGREG